jgi:ABC-type lipoprotein release transport system permease subunit
MSDESTKGVSTLQIAWRNLGRNKLRTSLVVAAIALGQFVVILVSGLMAGVWEEMQKTITGPLVGHVQIHHPEWREERAIDLYVDNLSDVVAGLESLPDVTSVSPRIYTPVLAASGEESSEPADADIAMIVGVDVSVASQHGNLLESLSEDQLPKGREVVVGQVLAKTLGLEAGQSIAVIGQDADEFPVSDLFDVKAIVSVGVDVVNRLGIVMPLDEAQSFLALQDQAHEIIIHGQDHHAADDLAIEARTLGKGMEVQSWREAMPEMARIMDMVGYFDFVFLGLLFVAAAAGIANTTMMSTFERTHEFGMLLALGTRPNRIIHMILLEAVILGLIGVAIGAFFGSIVVLITSQTGIDYGALSGGGEGESMAFQGVNLSFFIYPIFKFQQIIYGAIAVTITCVLAAAWPAAVASRLEPAEAMRS